MERFHFFYALIKDILVHNYNHYHIKLVMIL